MNSVIFGYTLDSEQSMKREQTRKQTICNSPCWQKQRWRAAPRSHHRAVSENRAPDATCVLTGSVCTAFIITSPVLQAGTPVHRELHTQSYHCYRCAETTAEPTRSKPEQGRSSAAPRSSSRAQTMRVPRWNPGCTSEVHMLTALASPEPSISSSFTSEC